ncbi:MAG: PEP-CTERM sorting domain-containing protein, partial [Rariglobus sp.]
GTGGNVAFANESTDAAWNVTSGVYRNALTGSGSDTRSVASVQVSNALNTSFTLSTQFTITTAPATNTSTYGFGLFGSNATFASSYYLADVNFGTSANDAMIRIVKLSGTTTTLNSGVGAAYAIALNTTYTLKMDIVSAQSGLTMTMSLFEGATQKGTSIVATDTTPLTGDYFGIRNRYTGNVAHSVSYDNFNITPIPEPSTLAMLAGGLVMGVVMVSRRARRS